MIDLRRVQRRGAERKGGVVAEREHRPRPRTGRGLGFCQIPDSLQSFVFCHVIRLVIFAESHVQHLGPTDMTGRRPSD